MIEAKREPLTERFDDFIRDRTFPCVGAKAALARGQMHTLIAGDIRSGSDDKRVYAALLAFSKAVAADPRLFQSLVVLYPEPRDLGEVAFEAALWRRLQSLAEMDADGGEIHDQRVSADPDDPGFSLSLGGEGFFVVGLHPGASRPARRFATPALVFNPRDQFLRLRVDGLYEGLRAKIIGRDIALAGTTNPMLARHGEISEARQYSGRRVGADWRCPFTPPARAA